MCLHVHALMFINAGVWTDLGLKSMETHHANARCRIYTSTNVI